MILVLGIGFSTLRGQTHEPRTICVAIRVDDIFMRSSPLQPQEIDGFIRVCERHGAHVILAVIPHRLLEPQNADGAMAGTLRRLVQRGHMVALHGYAHQCSRCGSTDHEFDCPVHGPAPTNTEMRELSDGKRLLEEITGAPVTTYISPGSDDQLSPQTASILTTLGIRWVTDTTVLVPTARRPLNRVPDLPEYTWDLSDSTFEASLQRALTDFATATARSNFFGIALHDHFTRQAFRHGIVLRWTDQFLTAIQRIPGIRIRFVTNDEMDPAWFSAAPEQPR